jgi:UDP-N-acetylmuramoyl-tripeptide--D-alanyl-D-alanine ligase
MRAEGGPYKAEDIAGACRGTLLYGELGAAFNAISTDSRDIRKNDLFVPLSGANFDGHDFVIPALEAGARGCLVNRELNREIPQHLTKYVLIQVQDTLRALSDLASAHRRLYHTPLIAVTGSSGKTTVKEMIAAVLKRSHHPLVSQENLNNLIGLPMTVLSLGPHHTAAVVEAGINRIGEMDSLALAASPDAAVITTIGPVHLEGLKSVEMVACEKFKLVRALSSQGTAVLPHGNKYLAPLLGDCKAQVVTFGIEKGDFKASNITFDEHILFQMMTPVGRQSIELRIAGRHNIANALAAAAACVSVGMSLENVAAGIREFLPPVWRLEIVNLPGNRRLIRDCYNANPQSMKAALQVLSEGSRGGSKKLAILADMMELGEYAESLHEEVGRVSAELGIDRIVFVGNSGHFFSKGFLSAGGNKQSLTLVPDKEQAWDIICPDVPKFETILVKGSRAMKMEYIADRIWQEN